MFEIVQIIWDVFIMRRSIKDGSLTWRKGIIASVLTALGYLILVPAGALYDKHPQYRPLFMVAVVLTAIDFIVLFWLGIYWWRHPETKAASQS